MLGEFPADWPGRWLIRKLRICSFQCRWNQFDIFIRSGEKAKTNTANGGVPPRKDMICAVGALASLAPKPFVYTSGTLRWPTVMFVSVHRIKQK